VTWGVKRAYAELQQKRCKGRVGCAVACVGLWPFCVDRWFCNNAPCDGRVRTPAYLCNRSVYFRWLAAWHRGADPLVRPASLPPPNILLGFWGFRSWMRLTNRTGQPRCAPRIRRETSF